MFDVSYVRTSDNKYVHNFNTSSGWTTMESAWVGMTDGVWDVTTNNGGATFASLQALLSDVNLNTLIPSYARHGGMAIRFVSTSDNKYIRYNLLADSFTTDTTQWAVGDSGVYVQSPQFVYVLKDNEGKILLAIKVDGSAYFGAGVPQQVKDYIQSKINEYHGEDIIAFLNGLEEGDKTLQQLLNEKVDKEEGKSLIDEGIAGNTSFVENPQFVDIEKDIEGKLLGGRKKDGTRFENMPFVFGDVRIKGKTDWDSLPSQITEWNNGAILPFYKNHLYDVVPQITYNGLQQDYSWGDRDTTTAQVYAKYDTLLVEGYSTSEVLGQACDGQDIKLYSFYPPRMTTNKADFIKGYPTLMIVAGQHGFEKSSAYGLYYFMKDVIENNDKNELLRYFRNCVRIIIVPVANPSGWDAKTYKNANGVNLNRNWWIPGWSVVTTDTSDINYQGLAPFDQPETAAIRDYILANKDKIDFFIDNHTNGQGKVAHNKDINWCDVTSCVDAGFEETIYYSGIRKVIYSHCLNVTGVINNLWHELLNSEDEDFTCSMVTYNPHMEKGWADSYCITQGIQAMCMEVFNGFPNSESAFGPETKQCVSMIDASILAHFCAYYSKY